MRKTITAYLAALPFVMLIVQPASSTPLGLSLELPNASSAFISVTYNAGLGTLTARGQAQQFESGGPIDQPGSPNIQNADFFTSFDLNAAIDNAGVLTGGTIVVSGELPVLGFNSGTLLTGTLTDLGFGGFGDPLEFLFDVTGGDAAGLYGTTGGISIIFSGFGGSFANDFSTSFTSIADVGAIRTATVPEPWTIAVFGFGLGVLAVARRRSKL